MKRGREVKKEGEGDDEEEGRRGGEEGTMGSRIVIFILIVRAKGGREEYFDQEYDRW